jgi:hypothetical protein
VRPTAQKEPKAPATTAPGELIVAWDNISLKKQTIVVGPIIPDLPIKNLEPGDDPGPVDPDPETPVDEPQQPEDEPQTPADEPSDNGDSGQPADTGATTPTTDSNGNGTDSSSQGSQTSTSSGNGSTNQSLGGKQTNAPATTAPLPPETGQGAGGSDRGPIILGGSLAAMLAGLGLVAVALRSRRKPEPTDE